ncbi:MAG TPA: S8 family serine peptidase [Actinomycetota bacterium]|nr:S8 family serine peptidase [Actinomycetota bacterium]
MIGPSLRRALVPTVAVLLIAALAGTVAAAEGSGSARSGPALVPGSPPAAGGGGASVDPLLVKRLARGEAVEALVTLDGATALAGATAMSAASSRDLLRTTVPAYRALKDGVAARVPGLAVLRDFAALPILHVRIDSRAELARLAADPAVAGIGIDRQDRILLSQSLALIGQPAAAAAGHTGLGVSVAVLDTGLNYTNPAFGTCPTPGAPGCRVLVAQDFAPDDASLDDNGHGTNVSGIVAGVAPEAGLLGLDVFNGNLSSASDQIAAINFVIANQATYNIRAINMSLGSANNYNTSPCSDPADPRVAAFANARAAGILPVVAAGNNAFSNGSFHVGITRPACIPGAFPVGAVYDSDVGGKVWGSPPNQCTDAATAADQITCFSQAWNNPMLLAPGALITAAGITQGGTSQATPHVAGAVAVLHDAGGIVSDLPALVTVDQVQNALLNSGPLIFDPLINQSVHRLDLPAAIAALGGLPPPPPPPTGPTVTSFSPTLGQVGTSVIITGTGLTGATAVTVNGVAAAFAVNLDTQVTATVPAGASTGPIAVTTPGGTGTSAAPFVVQHARDVSLHFSKAKGDITVLDGYNACGSGVPVKLQFFKNGKFKTIASGVTKPNGSYNLGNVTNEGKYRTLAKPTTLGSGDKCLKDISPTVRL